MFFFMVVERTSEVPIMESQRICWLAAINFIWLVIVGFGFGYLTPLFSFFLSPFNLLESS